MENIRSCCCLDSTSTIGFLLLALALNLLLDFESIISSSEEVAEVEGFIWDGEKREMTTSDILLTFEIRLISIRINNQYTRTAFP